MSKNVAIAYCAENQNTAQDIERKLNLAAYHFQHFGCSKTTAESPLSDLLSDYESPILLIISDNFLKSAQCMSRALKMMQRKGPQILTVVVDGQQPGEDGSTNYSPTNFDRVSDIIQYINYWQDQYLDLRRQKRDIDPGNEKAFADHLKVMREISSEVGEFLRVLRNSNYVSWDEFSQNNFEQFFAFQQDRSGWEAYDNLSATLPQDETAEKAKESAPVDIDLIPGIDQLNEVVETETETGEQPEEENSDPVEAVPTVAHVSEIEVQEDIDTPEEELEEPFDQLEIADEIIEMPSPEPEEQAPDEEISEKAASESPEDLKQEEEEEIEEEVEEEVEELESIHQSIRVKEAIERSEQLFELQQIREGFAVIENALEEFPGDIDLHYHYALSLVQLKDDFSAASQQLEIILEVEPDNIEAHFLLGKLYEINNNFDAAARHYEKTAALDPNHDTVHFQLGMLLVNQFSDQQKKAAKYLKQAFKLNPKNTEACYQYGLILHEQLGQSEKATKYLRKTIESNPNHPFVHYDLALVYHHLGKRKKAYASYLRATEINPELKTSENDEAFALIIPSPIQEVSAFSEKAAKASLEADTIEALKQNIYQLEEMIKAKQKEEEEVEQDSILKAMPPQVPHREEVVFITGATSGIGRATAEKFAAEGFKLLLNGRRKEKLEELKISLEEQYGTEIQILPFDVRNVNDVQEAIDSLEEPWQEIDILINNAGKAKGFDPIHQGQLHHWEEMIDTNLKGLLYLTRAISPFMVARQSGHIINICSTAGKEVYPKGNVYCATKFAVDALTKAMRIDLHTYNIRVSQVSPGHVEETEFAAVRFDGDTEKAKIYEDFLPLTSKDVAETIYFIVNQPKHVNIQDILLMGTQQASSVFVNRSGRDAL